jgi:hypothetical protein
MLRPTLLATLFLLVACSDDEPAQPTGTGGQAPGGMGGEGGTGAAGEGGGGGDPCASPASMTIGPDGGELSHCGATLTVPSRALAADQRFSIAIDDSPPGAPFERELASPVFVITPADPGLTMPASLTLEHEPAASRFELARYDERAASFLGVEPCEVDGDSLQQFVGLLGTWAVLRDVNDYPDSTAGLGDGSVDLDFLGDMAAYDVDSLGSYGIFQNTPGGGRSVTVIVQRDVAGGLERLRLDFSVDASGDEGAIIQVDWITTAGSGGYTFIPGLVGSGGTIDVTTTSAGRIAGTITANPQGGSPPAEEPLSATFDVAVELYAFPGELVCPGGKR